MVPSVKYQPHWMLAAIRFKASKLTVTAAPMDLISNNHLIIKALLYERFPTLITINSSAWPVVLTNCVSPINKLC